MQDRGKLFADRGDRRICAWLFLAMACLFLLFHEGAITVSDGHSMYETTKAFVERGEIDVPADAGVRGPDGKHYSKYGVGLPAISILPYALARPVARSLGGSRGEILSQAAVSVTIPLITAALVVALYLLARRLRASTRSSLLVAIGSVAGTFVLPYSKDFLSEPLTALCMVLAIERALARRPGAAGAALAYALLTRPQVLAFAPVLLFVLWRRDGIAALRRAAVPLALGVAAMGAWNVARFGSPLDFGYRGEGFTTPFLTGASGLLGSPTKSVLLFAPIVALVPIALMRLARRDRSAAMMIAANLGITFALTATWWSWAGGWSWGPRLLIPGLAPAFACIAPWLDQRAGRMRAALALFAVGAILSAPAMLVSVRAQQTDQGAYAPSILRQYELLAPTTSYVSDHLYERAGGDHRRYLALWEVGAAGVLGHKGLIASFAAAGMLAMMLAAASQKLRASVGGVVLAFPGSSAPVPVRHVTRVA